MIHSCSVKIKLGSPLNSCFVLLYAGGLALIVQDDGFGEAIPNGNCVLLIEYYSLDNCSVLAPSRMPEPRCLLALDTATHEEQGIPEGDWDL